MNHGGGRVENMLNFQIVALQLANSTLYCMHVKTACVAYDHFMNSTLLLIACLLSLQVGQ